jgi:hypothetical protein
MGEEKEHDFGGYQGEKIQEVAADAVHLATGDSLELGILVFLYMNHTFCTRRVTCIEWIDLPTAAQLIDAYQSHKC